MHGAKGFFAVYQRFVDGRYWGKLGFLNEPWQRQID